MSQIDVELVLNHISNNPFPKTPVGDVWLKALRELIKPNESVSATPTEASANASSWPYDRQPGWSYYNSSQSQPSQDRRVEDRVECTPGMQVSETESPVALTQQSRPSVDVVMCNETMASVASGNAGGQNIQQECLVALRRHYMQDMQSLQRENRNIERSYSDFMNNFIQVGIKADELISAFSAMKEDVRRLTTRQTEVDLRLRELDERVRELEVFETSFCTPKQ